ncbi:DNA topoisomerase III [Vibrio viridaestus]|uniref:DNA topoisomerase 3 n=1 Tax=Vibrio viridaestus TaxID=2487322 RepID=A0A3N9U7M4_9VIBR|nr:DNA topoisomerase III [Vibrio viridaestus]RQW64176.1 DNA topoisomerase III [Vibrio viridaestus]
MPKLFIAEKPSLGRAIADALPKPHKREDGAIRCGNGDVVTWCIGHLLEQAQPDEYDDKYKKWSLDTLPISPEKWILKPRKSAAKQLSVVKKLLKQSFDIVHAGDPDREGQLLVDEVIDYCRVPQDKKVATQRLLINDLNLSAVKKSLQKMQANSDFIPLSVSALARSRADWLYGMNMSRAYTLLGQKVGYRGVLSVGRVQTPVLGLVVRRDEEIENFVAQDYFTLHALIPYSDQYHSGDIRARWKPSEACGPWLDEDGRVLNLKLVENVASRIKAKPAKVMKSEHKKTKQNAPLPYSLSALQIDASKRFNLNAQQTLDACQSLYEKHKLITYPRSDCRYLPNGHFHESRAITTAIAKLENRLQDAVGGVDLQIRSKAWNDSKVEAHHAIIPTDKGNVSGSLTDKEKNVYYLIARQYLLQFYPAAEYAESRLEFDIEGGLFIASGKTLLFPGWKVVTGFNQEQDEPNALVPELSVGETLVCREGEIGFKKTEPPAYFTEATLLKAMTGIARFVSDKGLKAILRETDGLGTEATRAGIIDTLVKRQLIERQGKQIRSSLAGRGLVHALPDSATYPDMTAHWERQLQDMAEKGQAYTPFMTELQQQIATMIENVRYQPVPESLNGLSNVGASISKSGRRSYSGRRKKSQPRGRTKA